ncbi:GDSL-type esterase/lipase family protein [Myxococcota bacterium]
MMGVRRFLGMAIAGLAIALTMPDVTGARVEAMPASAKSWVGSWAASPQPLDDCPVSLTDVTLRQIVHLTLGGHAVRVRLDNTFGKGPVTFGRVHVALQHRDGAIRADTDRPVRFGGKRSVTVAQGAQALSDPIRLPIAAESNLAVSLYLPGSAEVTGHHNAGQTSYVSVPGDHVAEAGASSYTATISDWYWLSGVDVFTASSRGAIVVLGDSITNGAWSAWARNGRWPDYLARRQLQLPSSHRRSVLNQGIDGNKMLLHGVCCGNSVPALARLHRDVIAQVGVTHVLVLMGTHDLADNGEAAALIAGYKQLATQLHAQGLVVVGGTLPPWGGFDDTGAHETERQKFNQWLRTTRHVDGFVDFDQILHDPLHPARLLPAYDSSDHLHPSPAGYEAMGSAIDLTLFRSIQTSSGSS